jgi:hypothetical protein
LRCPTNQSSTRSGYKEREPTTLRVVPSRRHSHSLVQAGAASEEWTPGASKAGQLLEPLGFAQPIGPSSRHSQLPPTICPALPLPLLCTYCSARTSSRRADDRVRQRGAFGAVSRPAGPSERAAYRLTPPRRACQSSVNCRGGEGSSVTERVRRSSNGIPVSPSAYYRTVRG